MARLARLKKEIEQLTKEPPPGIVVWPVDDSFSNFQAQILGPEGISCILGLN
jgi:ubiquitin-protein ligase